MKTMGEFAVPEVSFFSSEKAVMENENPHECVRGP